MTVKSEPYYWIECDDPGCGVKSADLGDYSAWGDDSQALYEWSEWEGQETPDGKHYCERHRKPQCDECEQFVPVNDERLCADCAGADQ